MNLSVYEFHFWEQLDELEDIQMFVHIVVLKSLFKFVINLPYDQSLLLEVRLSYLSLALYCHIQ